MQVSFFVKKKVPSPANNKKLFTGDETLFRGTTPIALLRITTPLCQAYQPLPL